MTNYLICVWKVEQIVLFFPFFFVHTFSFTEKENPTNIFSFELNHIEIQRIWNSSFGGKKHPFNRHKSALLSIYKKRVLITILRQKVFINRDSLILRSQKTWCWIWKKCWVHLNISNILPKNFISFLQFHRKVYLFPALLKLLHPVASRVIAEIIFPMKKMYATDFCSIFSFYPDWANKNVHIFFVSFSVQHHVSFVPQYKIRERGWVIISQNINFSARMGYLFHFSSWNKKNFPKHVYFVCETPYEV